MQAVKIEDHVLLKDDWATFAYRVKPPRHVENVIMMVNNAGESLNLALAQKRKKKLYKL